jgi:hypothetical protein
MEEMKMENKDAVPNPYEGLTAEQVLDTMRRLKAQETGNQVAMGLLYNYLVDSKLLEGTKYKSALDYICQNIQEMSKAALLMYGAVARVFSHAVCAVFGISRLSLLLTYQKLTKIELNAEEPGNIFILVPDSTGEVKPKLFANCSVEDLRQALAHLRQKSVTPVPAEERAVVDRCREAVLGGFPKGTPIRVQMRNDEGHGVMDIKGIPVLQLSTLTEALLELSAADAGVSQVKPAA